MSKKRKKPVRHPEALSTEEVVRKVENYVDPAEARSMGGYVWCKKNGERRPRQIPVCSCLGREANGCKYLNRASASPCRPLLELMYSRGRACRLRAKVWCVF